ncbi:MAG: AAA family ATPase [Parcubacteria group bacterium]|jgi:dephospho-CoA kinase
MTKEKKRIVIGLVGATGSGKDTVANYLEEKHGVQKMRFADPLKETLAIYFDKFSKEDQSWLAVQFRNRFGDDILSRALRKRIDNGEGIIMVNGVRFWEDFHFVKSYTDSYILYIDVPQKIRWERTINRGEKSDDAMSFEKFIETEQTMETEKYVPEMGAKADFVIENDKDLAHLLAEADKVMEEIKKR